ncbi:putative Thiamine pyrophosphokinase [Glarea lozoyensis 74030]|uniref:Putative Thiamine pyrophosphokinase n=1 Tax=Glarea lozoyensis (strain ATCC 74030 / MF5533) TaxID=1104152 RepID=H0EMR1_GLAL7|nr:putative Thiamine pyrophosphokinase [Glarea lozoyensis 74030]
MKSNLDLIKECDSLPYPNDTEYDTFTASFYTLTHTSESYPIPITIGQIPEFVFNALAKVPISIKGELEVNRNTRTVSAFPQATEPERSAAVAATCDYWRKNKTFKVLEGWRNELYPVYGPKNELLFNVERSASVLFGTTYGGMLDNTVAGGISSGEDPFESLVREADEEASLPEKLVRENTKAAGIVTYSYLRDPRAGGESGVVQPEKEIKRRCHREIPLPGPHLTAK